VPLTAAMPDPSSIIQEEPFSGTDYLGIQTDYSGNQGIPGTDMGIYYGWSGIVTLEGTDAAGNSYSLDVDLSYEAGDAYSYSVDIIDESINDMTDIVSGNVVSAWLGDHGGGHRHTAPTQTFSAGDDSLTFGTAGSVGAAGFGDGIGLSVASRTNLGSASFFDNLNFGGSLEQDEAGLIIMIIPEPSSAFLSILALAIGFSRRSRK